MFAELVLEGWPMEAVIDTANPETVPPLPDLRRVQIPVGPVAVFAASNFPFAFSVLGGDVASALAAGCAVIVKAHPSHPETSEISARVVLAALQDREIDLAAFALIHGEGAAVGEALVASPDVAAVAFTGSLRGGRAIFDIASRRADPIPVYAEMGSLNPVFVTGGVLAVRAGDFVRGFAASLTVGNGQFCTKPGLLVVPEEHVSRVVQLLAAEIAEVPGGYMLNKRMEEGLRSTVDRAIRMNRVEVVARGNGPRGDGYGVDTVVGLVDSPTFLSASELAEEFFGPFGLIISCASNAAMLQVAERITGSLTACIHCLETETGTLDAIVGVLEARTGRLIWNGFPTGVPVRRSTHHGGPYPATTVPQHTSVGAYATRRFTRPVCYQDSPQGWLPPALRDANPLRIGRIVNGRWTNQPV
jgi:NADP-dependent aldehyde dehydrogenase